VDGGRHGNEIGGDGLEWSARSEHRPVCEADDRGPRGFVFFQFIQNRLNMEIEKRPYRAPKIPKFLHVGSLGYYEHFSPLCRHPISNRNRVKNNGLDSPFESLLNF
jgi:hypothetical protein